MPRLRATLKRGIAFTLYWSGVLWLIARWRLRDRAVVVTYHRVLPPDADSFSDPGIVVTPTTFARNMRFLRRHFNPLSADEFRECLERGSFPRRACLVTFDDGWLDNERHALPILEECGVPAIVFVATSYVGSASVFWQERLRRQLFELRRHSESGNALLSELGISNACSAGERAARDTIDRYVISLKSQDLAVIEDVRVRVEAACRSAGVSLASPGDDRFMNWDDVTRLASSGRVAIGSHGHSHVPLTRLDHEETAADLSKSVESLTLHGFPAPTMFAYPNGDYDEPRAECVAHAGLAVAFTTEHGFVAPGDDRRRLPRVNVHEGSAASAPEFLCRILGVF